MYEDDDELDGFEDEEQDDGEDEEPEEAEDPEEPEEDELDGFEAEASEDQGTEQAQGDGLDGFEAGAPRAEAGEPTEQADSELDGFEAGDGGEEIVDEGAGGDSFVETEDVAEAGFGDKLKSSIAGVFFGFILFIASFFILYKGEGHIDRSKIVQQATAIKPDDSAKAADGQTVKFTGKAACDAPVTDAEYLPDGKFLHLERNAQMYAWVEKSETKSRKVRGGRKGSRTRRTTTYRYVKEWTSSPAESSSFKKPQGHFNPPMTVKSKSWTAKSVNVGSLTVDLRAARLSGAPPLPEPKPAAAAKAFDPNAPQGSGPVAFAGAPAAAKPLATRALKGKTLLLYSITKETYGQDGKWKPTKTSLKVADGITVGKVKIDTTGLKTLDMPRLVKRLYKPKTAKTSPKPGNERASIRWIEVGKPVTFSGTLTGNTLSHAAISATVVPGASGPKSPWYIGKGSPSAPQVGDVKLSFNGIEPGCDLFVCGALKGAKVEPTTYEDIQFLFAAPMSEAEVISQLKGEHTAITWGCRIGGFICMWLGMSLMVGPFTFLLNYIPVLGALASGLIYLVFGIISLVLSVLTVLLAKFFWVFLIVVIALLALMVAKARRIKPAPRR